MPDTTELQIVSPEAGAHPARAGLNRPLGACWGAGPGPPAAECGLSLRTQRSFRVRSIYCCFCDTEGYITPGLPSQASAEVLSKLPLYAYRSPSPTATPMLSVTISTSGSGCQVYTAPRKHNHQTDREVHQSLRRIPTATALETATSTNQAALHRGLSSPTGAARGTKLGSAVRLGSREGFCGCAEGQYGLWVRRRRCRRNCSRPALDPSRSQGRLFIRLPAHIF